MRSKSDSPYNIVAPVCSVEEVEKVLHAGADEVYFGIMPDEWMNTYGNSDFISRRQSELSHVTKFKDFTNIVQLVNDQNKKATLILNSKYTERQVPCILDIISEWELCGGHSVMVSDIGILLGLKANNSKLKRHLSVLAGVFNSYSIEFFAKLNVSRIVLPRELRISEIRQILLSHKHDIEYELIAMFQKCEFIDSFCGFYHAVNYRPLIVDNSSELLKNKKLPIINSYDINYEGHGCELNYVTDSDTPIKHLKKNECTTPYCAACQLVGFHKIGIRNFKIAGRGYPIELIMKAIRFLRNSIENIHLQPIDIRANYKSIFGGNCNMNFCYYK